MGIKALMHLACAKVASIIKGVPLEGIKGALSTSKQGPTGDTKLGST